MGYSQPLDLVDITLPRLHNTVQDHINKTLVLLPDDHHTAILEQYNKIYHSKHGGESAANLFILHLGKYPEVVGGIPYYHLPAFLRVFYRLLHADKTGKKLAKKMCLISKIRGFWCIGFDDVECKPNAETKADHCKLIIENSDLEGAIDYATSKGILFIAGEIGAQKERLTNSKWWAGQLKGISSQGREVLWQILGLVNSYISKQGYEAQQKKHESTINMLAENVAVSPEGKEVNLLDIAMSAIRGRFSRLLNWSDGMGEYAEKYGHACAMYTITCPSRMHPNSKKYDGTSPREAQQYLSTLWNQANARFKKRGIYPYGVRVSESHKDGAPHWHILLFAPMSVLIEIDGILSDHALRVDGFELGADLHRYEFKIIDKQKGGAKPSSYLFKYLMKGLGGDAETYTVDDIDKILTEKLTEVKAWARTHGIRQVQIVGGASVGVWDELRRMGDKELDDNHLQAMKKACIDNDFCTYFEMQGGHSPYRYPYLCFGITPS